MVTIQFYDRETGVIYQKNEVPPEKLETVKKIYYVTNSEDSEDYKEIDLSPGCGTVIVTHVGNHKITLKFNNNAEEAMEARRKLVDFH